MKFNKLNETYWIDNKEVMDQVSKLGKELEADGFKFYSDRYSGSTYYDFYTKRGDNGAICKAVQYSYEGAQIIDITIDQLIGKEPIDSFETMRRKLGKMLLPQNEAIEEDKEDKFVLYFPYLEPKIISKDRAIRQMEFELNEFKNNSGASVAGRGFGIYCLQSYDPDTDSVWTGRYSSKEFLKVLDESMLREAFDTTLDFPYMFFYSCNNPTFGYDFQLFASSLGARKVYGRYKGTGAGTYFYLVPSEEVYEKLKAVAKNKYTVEMQRLLPYDAEKYPKIQYIKESLNEDSDDDIVWPIGPNTLTFSGANRRLAALRGDIKLLMNCDTAEDVKAHAEEFQMYNCANIIERKMAKGMSEADAIDSTETYLMNCLSQWKSDMVKFRDEAAVAMQTFNTVKNALSQYELISADEERCVLKYRPIEGAAHKDCIEFVDAVVAAVNGKYNFTGRGGSWTRWDIRTADGVMLKAGWDDDGDTWSVTFPRLKFEAMEESLEMAVGGDDFDGEIAAMRAEQAELEARRAARKERFALMHKLFDKHMDADPNARWIDKIYDLFEDAEQVVFIGNKYGTLPGRTEDGQPVRYRYSIEEYDIYTDPYRDFVYIGTNNDDPLAEDLEDDFDLLMKASELKCKLSRYDIEEANEPSELVMYMEDVYHALVDAYGADKIKWWRFYEDDDMDGVKVIFKDGAKKIVEIVHGRVYEGDNLDEAVDSTVTKQQYVICGVTNEGTRMLYDAVNDNFTTDYNSATKYDDMDVARDDWFQIPRSGFRRIFIPVYDPAVFESLNEGSGADTAHVASDALKIAAQGDKHKWAKTAADIIDVIPDDFADQLFDAVKSKASDIKLSNENKKKIVDASNGELTEESVADCDTLGKILALVDGFEWAKTNPGLLKGFVMVVLSIIAIIEPTPVLEIITLIVGFLPAEWVAKVLAVINVVGNPLGAAGTAANKIYKTAKKNEAFDADKVQKRIACTTEFDNGHVFHNDYFRASSAEAEERAKQASIENPDKVFYVKYDDVMNPSSDIKWKNGEQLNEADEPIYFDPDDEFEVDFRYYVYANNDDVVSDAFDFEEDAIAWAQENNYPIVKIHNYYRDTDGELNPDGNPEIIWKA